MSDFGLAKAIAKREAKEEKIKIWVDDFRKNAKKKRQAKERVRTRTEWLGILQSLVNQYVLYVKEAGQPCCTCGTTSALVKYDAGHCFTRGARPELRFELTNIHKQCSNYCNVNNSGKQAEHKKYISERYGSEHLEKLEDRSKWTSLKDRFKDNESIKEEILRYRKLLRNHKIKPRR